MTQVFLTSHTELARAGATLCCWGKLSTSPNPSHRQESNSHPQKHHYCYCKPLPLGNHPHPDEDRTVPGKENRSPEGAWAHSSFPELLATCSPVAMYSERTEEQEGGKMIQGRAALSYSQLLSAGIGKNKPIPPETPHCEWQLDALYQEPE